MVERFPNNCRLWGVPAGLLGLSVGAIRRAGDFKKRLRLGRRVMKSRWASLVSTTALVSTIFLIAPECVQAQDAADSVPKDNNLPAIRVEAPPAPRPAQRADRNRGGESSRNRAAVQRTPTPQHVTVNAPTPLPGPSQVPPEKAFDADKVPGTITTIDTSQIARTNSLNVTDSLQHYVPGVSVSTVGGSDFQPNVDFRGYVASPVSGTPQ